MITNMIWITLIVVFIVDYSGVIGSLENGIRKIYESNGQKIGDINLPLIGCSLCVTFWLNLGYIIYSGAFSFRNIFYVCVCAFATIIVKELYFLIREIVVGVFGWLNNKIG